MNFKFLCFGLIFFIDVTFGGVDLLPDFIGYFFILRSCINLALYDRNFIVSKFCAYLLLIISLLDIYKNKEIMSIMVYSILEIVMTVIVIIIFIFLYRGIKVIFNDSTIIKSALYNIAFAILFLGQLSKIINILLFIMLKGEKIIKYMPAVHGFTTIIILVSIILLIKFFRNIINYCRIE